MDAIKGDDARNGLSSAAAFRTIQRAADLAAPGTTIHILPGVYREAVSPGASGTPEHPILYLAENGPGTVIVRGSVASASLEWTRLSGNQIGLPAGVDPANIYYADLSSWGLQQAPRFLVLLDGAGSIASRLMPAREPDWRVVTEWKNSEFWWLANGGSSVAGCDPVTDEDHQCDEPSRSYTQLTDDQDDTDPAGIEPGSLAAFGDLTGAVLVAMDNYHALYTFRRTILQHDVAAGRVTVDSSDHDGDPGLGWGSKYYVENHPALLDQPGEWWFEAGTGRLYVWSPTGENPARMDLEISQLEDGFDLTDRSSVTLDGLWIQLFNEDAYQIVHVDPGKMAHGNQVRNSIIQYTHTGIGLYHYVQGTQEQYAIDGFLLENTELSYIDSAGFDSYFYWPEAPSPAQFSYAGVRNLTLRGNEFHHLGFNAEERSGVGVRVFFPHQVRFENNYIHHVAQNGVHFHLSLNDSEKEYDLSPQEIRLGEILIKDNIFEKTCQAASDCGGLKFGGSNRPDTHVFRDVLIMGNSFRDTFGWSYVSIQRQMNTLGDGNGFYLDYASGVHVYRNIAYNNSGTGFKLACLWRDGDAVFYNNIAANNYVYGFKFTGTDCDNHGGSVNTQLVNNIFINNGAYGFQFVSTNENQYGNVLIDHNLYFQNGWDNQWVDHPLDIQLYQASRPAEPLSGVKEIRAATNWEAHGVGGDPGFLDYAVSSHDLYTDTWPDFHLKENSRNTVDRGTAALPASLTRLLETFGVVDTPVGPAYDIGPYELGFPGHAFSPARLWAQASWFLAP